MLVLLPDMRLDGGVTNYYRQLALDHRPDVEHFHVNHVSARGALRKIAFLLPNYLRYVRRAREFPCVHVNPSLNPKSFYRDAVYTALAHLIGRKVIVTFHGWSYDFERTLRRSHLRQAVLRWGYSAADAVIVLGDTFRARLLELGLPSDVPVHVETTIADDVGFDPKTIATRSLDEGPVNFLFLARAIREKGLFIGLEAFLGCRQLLPAVPMHFYVAGDGEDLAEAKSRYGHRDDVTFLGHVDDAERRKLLTRCHFLMFPTYHGEGLPCTLLEAMLYGLPVLTRPEGAIPEIVENGTHGLLTASRDPQVFAEFAAALIQKPETYRIISRRNLELAQSRFRTDVVRGRLLAIYREVLEESNTSST